MPMTCVTFLFVPLASYNSHLMTLQFTRERVQQNNNHLPITFAVCLSPAQGDSDGFWSPHDLAINIMADFLFFFYYNLRKVDYAYVL